MSKDKEASKSKESKKDLIADTALSCFMVSGYGGTSVDEIVKASGVSKGGIYWYFKSKEDIFLYLIERWVKEWIAEYLTLIKDTDSTADKLKKYLEHHFAQIDTPISALVLEFLLQAKEQETINKLRNGTENIQRLLVQIMTDAVNKGEFRPLDPLVLTQTFLAMLHGIGMQAQIHKIHKDKDMLRKTTYAVLDIFLQGVRNN